MGFSGLLSILGVLYALGNIAPVSGAGSAGAISVTGLEDNVQYLKSLSITSQQSNTNSASGAVIVLSGESYVYTGGVYINYS